MSEISIDSIKTISETDALKDYIKLCSVFDKLNPQSLIGNKAMDYFFFKHRINTKTSKGLSFPEWLKTDDSLKPYFQKLIDYKIKNNGKTLIQAKYDAFCLYSGSGTINAFKPILARQLYLNYKPTSILDFSAGWGGRCLSAMSLNINYTGFDTNEKLRDAYNGIVNMYPTKSKVQILFEDSSKVNFSDYSYDMVFTSPPYFKKTTPTEIYEGMPTYSDRKHFNDSFLFPVIRNSFQGLSTPGIFALNIPVDMYEDVRTVLGEASETIPLTLKRRSSKKRLGGEYSECIYVWRK